MSGGLAGSQLADPREACREAVGIISLCPSPVPFSRGSPSTLIWRLIRQKWEQLAGQRQDRKMGSGLFAAHTTEQWAGGCASISTLPYPRINSYLSPASLKWLLMLLVHPRLRQSSPSGKETHSGDEDDDLFSRRDWSNSLKNLSPDLDTHAGSDSRAKIWGLKPPLPEQGIADRLHQHPQLNGGTQGTATLPTQRQLWDHSWQACPPAFGHSFSREAEQEQVPACRLGLSWAVTRSPAAEHRNTPSWSEHQAFSFGNLLK